LVSVVKYPDNIGAAAWWLGDGGDISLVTAPATPYQTTRV
jgi:hypothetical protein